MLKVLILSEKEKKEEQKSYQGNSTVITTF